MPTPHRVFLTDDHQLILDGLMALFAQADDFEVIATAHTGREALQKVPILKPDLLVIDLDMPGGLNGIETTRQLKEKCPELKIVILTMHLEPALATKISQIGADGYMVKDSNSEEFLQGLRLVIKGQKFFGVHVTQALLEDAQSDQPSSISLHLKLSERELEVLKQLVEGFSSKEIADNLHIGSETVNTYRKNLLRKLNARNVAHLVKIALQSGIVL